MHQLRTSHRRDSRRRRQRADGVAVDPLRRSPTSPPSVHPLDVAVNVQLHAAVEWAILDARVVAAAVLCTFSTPLFGHAARSPILWWSIAYALWAMAARIRISRTPALLLRFATPLHAVDLGWMCGAVILDDGLMGDTFPLSAFVIAAAAHRAGVARAMLEGAIILACATLSVAGALDVHLASYRAWAPHTAYVGTLAVLFAVISLRLRQTILESAALAQLVQQIQGSSHLDEAARGSLTLILRMFGARAVMVIAGDTDTGVMAIWRARRHDDRTLEIERQEDSFGDTSRWTRDVPAGLAAFELRRNTGTAGDAEAVLELDRSGRPVDRKFRPAPALLAEPWCVLMGAVIGGDAPWHGLLLVMDPAPRLSRDSRLRLLYFALQRALPPLANLYLQQRLRSRAESIERGRLARELHDGPVQSLAAIEMRLDVAARRADAPTLAHELRTLRDLVHDESLNLRDVMQRLRYCDVTPDRLRLELGDLVGRFAAISRIHAQVDWRVARLEVPPAVCRELLRIVQEALVNVRRHSGATRVNVALAQHRRSLTLTIADNGVGLGFKGRVSPREAAAPSLPRVIRERVDMLGGRLEIESGPAGTTLWIAIPTCLEE